MKRTDKIITQLNRLGLEAFTDTLDKHVYTINSEGSIDLMFNTPVKYEHIEGTHDVESYLSVRILTKKGHSIHCGSFVRGIRDFNTLELSELEQLSNVDELIQLVINKAAVGLRLVA